MYSRKQLEPVPAELRERYFVRVDGGFAVRENLRRSVVFGRNDLRRDAPISGVDLLVSRNTLMNFGLHVQDRILANFHLALNRGGFLVVGKAEALQSTVEELRSTNEELQNSNEELQTTNEELQSTKEELDTMNEELQSTNEELETMNDELRDRTDETMRADSLLASVLSGIPEAVVVDREVWVR